MNNQNGKCFFCGTNFIMLSTTQKYCSEECGRKYRKANKGKILFPSITFNCSQCGKVVVTDETTGDKRSRFCSAACEKKYWRHPHWENPSTRINFRSITEYENYEKRTNAE